MRKILVLVFLLFTSPAFSEEEKIECIGPEPADAKMNFVFLHGAGLEGRHRFNVKVLKEIADKKKVRFAIPIAKWQCTSGDYKGKPCWMVGPFDSNSYKPALKTIEQAADACFRGRDHGLIGFSNGALLVSSLRMNCVPNKFTRLIAVGLSIKGGYKWDVQGLRGCSPQLNILIGDKDPYKDETKKSYELMKSREADVTYEEYEGDHELKTEPLLQFF